MSNTHCINYFSIQNLIMQVEYQWDWFTALYMYFSVQLQELMVLFNVSDWFFMYSFKCFVIVNLHLNDNANTSGKLTKFVLSWNWIIPDKNLCIRKRLCSTKIRITSVKYYCLVSLWVMGTENHVSCKNKL